MANSPSKKYMVGTATTGQAYADTILEAKKLGNKMSTKLMWRGKYNIPFLNITIWRRSGPASWKNTGWVMHVPVRGSGKSADKIISEILHREKVSPFKWHKKKN